MKTIIRITKQEAIDAFREKHKVEKSVVVEIEETSNTFTYAPSMPTANQCLVCGEYTGNAIHNCKGYKVIC